MNMHRCFSVHIHQLIRAPKLQRKCCFFASFTLQSYSLCLLCALYLYLQPCGSSEVISAKCMALKQVPDRTTLVCIQTPEPTVEYEYVFRCFPSPCVPLTVYLFVYNCRACLRNEIFVSVGRRELN